MPGSIASEMELEPGDFLLSINGQEVKDMLDYRWLTVDECFLMEVEKPCGEIWELEIETDGDCDLGLSFAKGSMGEDRRCVNACIFCFVDQQPPGLRESLYVKDDDPYQSFVLGNYVTLTNLSDDDIRQVVKHRLSPLRISVHAADIQLRQRMMGSPRAAKLFDALEQFSQAGLEMHFQVVLCKGINDGPALDYTIERLLQLGRGAKSLAVVPVGLTRYRDGLFPLEAFSSKDAAAVIAQVDEWQGKCLANVGSRFVFLADEWYVLAGKALPGYDAYEDFPQLDNGVGMMVLFEDEFCDALAMERNHPPTKATSKASSATKAIPQHATPVIARSEATRQSNPLVNTTADTTKKIAIAAGKAAGDFMFKLSRLFMESFPNISVDIHVIENEFYGPNVTVSGLITGCDIISQLEGRCGEVDVLFIPENAFRAGTEDMLCGTTLSDISKTLNVKAEIGAADGGEFFRQLTKFVGRNAHIAPQLL